MGGYYYRQLNAEEKSVYDGLCAGFTALAPVVRVRRLDGQRLADVFTVLRLDNPLLFYVPAFSWRFDGRAEHVEILPQYLFDKGKIRDQQRSLSRRIQRLTLPLAELDDWGREKAIHDFILENVRYDKLKKAYSHEIIGPLGQGVGVCEGIAKTVKVLCDAAGVPCIVALCEAAPELGIQYRHAWNLVQTGGRWHHLDATFDNSLQAGTPRYDYFNLDDSHIFRDHQAPLYPLPACADSSESYYRREKLSLTKAGDVENRVRQALRKKKETFVFHWRGGGLNREILSELLRRCGGAAAERGQFVTCSLNLPQSVIQLYFRTQPSGGQVITLQQPDEEREEDGGRTPDAVL